MELEEERAPISVTLIKPEGIATPVHRSCQELHGSKAQPSSSGVCSRDGGEAILHAAENPVRDMFIGSGGKGMSAMGYYAPRLADKYMERPCSSSRSGMSIEQPRPDGLYSATNDPRERGPYPGHVMETSYYTKAAMHPLMTGALDAGSGTGGHTSDAQPPRKA